MKKISPNKHIVIIGAGLGGCFLAVTLAQLGYRVDVYEYRSDYRQKKLTSDKSFNLTLYYRGISALKKIGLWEDVKKIIVPVFGNVVHMRKSKTSYDPYAKLGDEILYTIHRTTLNETLMLSATSLPGVSFHFDMKCVGIDRKNRTVQFENTQTLKKMTVTPDVIFGADGVHSIVREAIHTGVKALLLKERSDWGYKEVRIPKALAKELHLKDNATHTWPKKNTLLLAFPNPDQSFTLMLNLPLEGADSFSSLTDALSIETYIRHFFPELTPALAEITEAILTRTTGHFTTILTTPWFYEDFMVILGDAAHGVMPFYGQGMCAAFEDCLFLQDLIQKHDGDFKKIFPEFQEVRKRNTDVLADLSKENFIELRDNSCSPEHVMTNKFDTFLHGVFPKSWSPPLYKMIAHDDMPYADAVELKNAQKKKAAAFGLPMLVMAATIPYFLYKKARKSTK